MEIVSNNDKVAVVDFQLEKRRRSQTQAEKHRESILGACPGPDDPEVLDWVCQRIAADVLPDGRTSLWELDDGPFAEEAMHPVLDRFHDLLREVHKLSLLKEMPNGHFLRLRLEVTGDWSEHPLNPENEWSQIDNMSEPRDFELIGPEEQARLDEVADRLNAKFGNPPEEI